MRRRDFIGCLIGAAAVPAAARAKEPATSVIGYLDILGSQKGASTLNLFRKALSGAGYVEGRNLSIESRWGEGQADRLPALAADLVRRRVAVIVTVADPAVTLAAKAATAAIPIVFTSGADPIRLGLVDNLDRPGGNVTGVTYFDNDLIPRRLKLLRQAVPHGSTMAFLVSETNRTMNEWVIEQMQAAARSLGQAIAVLSVNTANDIDKAFAKMAQQQAGGLIVNGNRFLFGQSDQLIALAARYRIPAIYFTRAFVEAGGLMSYGDDRFGSWVLAANYVGRILKGEWPANLPVTHPIKFELAINLKTAAALGFTVPRSMRTMADEVIE